MAFVYQGVMVDLGFGRGWMNRPAALSLFRLDARIGHAWQITEAGRTWDQQNEHYQTYLRVGYPIALSPDAPSLHQLGNAMDTNERITWLLNEYGWYHTVYRWVNGVYTLVEEWHYEYFPEKDQHINEGMPAGHDDIPFPEGGGDMPITKADAELIASTILNKPAYDYAVRADRDGGGAPGSLTVSQVLKDLYEVLVFGGTMNPDNGRPARDSLDGIVEWLDQKGNGINTTLAEILELLKAEGEEPPVVVPPKAPNAPKYPAPVRPAGGWPLNGRNATGDRLSLVPLRPTVEIQRKLIALDLMPDGSDDGAWGPQTSASEAAFQQTRWIEADAIHGLTSDGLMFPPAGAKLFGLDYSWARPDPQMLADRGVNFVGRYLWESAGNKGISRAEYDELADFGIATFFFYETSASDSMALGFNKGVEHAKAAEEWLRKLGLPGMPIHFNVDHDSSVDQLPAILEGLRGAASIVGKQRAGIYGEYDVVKAALDAGYTYACQTYAWSGFPTKWDARVTTRQWSNGQRWTDAEGNSSDIDFEWAMADDFGQRPVT